MSASSQDVLYFMNVGVSLTPAPELSFEELRIQDYLKAYMSTRQPPAPCPQTPEDPAVRASLGLPPLFVPMPVRNTDGGSSNGVARLPTDLPGVHSFEPSKITGESFQCISAQPLYSLFSHEELRHYAYAAGNKVAPPSTSNPSAQSTPFYAKDSSSTSYLTITVTPGSPEFFMSITASRPHDKQSFEELRIDYLMGPKEPPPSTKLYEPLLGRPRGEAFSVSQPSPLMF